METLDEYKMMLIGYYIQDEELASDSKEDETEDPDHYIWSE